MVMDKSMTVNSSGGDTVILVRMHPVSFIMPTQTA
uniref:Uncharacterized protein n=1 Tax=Arundo donax TaxID=35708 RepID=A0A0A9BAJ6_ARUDO